MKQIIGEFAMDLSRSCIFQHLKGCRKDNADNNCIIDPDCK